MTEVTRVSVDIKILYPGVECGYIHLLNHERMCKKSDFEKIKLATNCHSDKVFPLT